MDERKAGICLVLVLLLSTLAQHAYAEQWCWYEVSVSPICAGFTCKFDCWFFAKVNKAKVQSHKCLGKGYKIKCLCQLCKNV
uniref:Knottin scorpion toxin-like domain-containing protein n=1 Tax=Oryza glaberrima TaxID=4538 RepID=I1QGX9_ORYGL